MDPYYQRQVADSSAEYGGVDPSFIGGDTYGGENPFWKDIGSSIYQSGKDFLTGRYGGKDAIKNIGKDAMSVWMALRAKKDQEGLNNAEMEQFNKLNQRMEAAQTEFTENIAGGGVQNIPTDVSVFSETTGRPDMITTATPAEGGRIGAFNGGIQGLMPQQGLDPRMGYAAHGGRIGYLHAGKVHSVKHKIILKQIEKLENMIAAGVDSDGKLQARLDQLKATPTTGLGTGPDLVLPDEKAQGGRIGAQGGGIMPLLDMGGMEKDYRQEGGFVPIGRKEKADDVPARLSKNEFVFTADAVKAAGGGDIDEGAQRMYNVMKNLEAGGQISQQSQGQA